VVGLLQPGHDLEHGGLAGTVGADDADLGSGVEGQGDVVENDLLAGGLADLVHGVDELSHWGASPSSGDRTTVCQLRATIPIHERTYRRRPTSSRARA